MKRSTKWLMGIGFTGSLLVGYLLGVIVDYPRPSQDELSGTIGKVTKYQKPVMSQRDVELRNTLSKDTAKLKEMIGGLAGFTVVTDRVGKSIDKAVLVFRLKGMDLDPEGKSQLELLKDYSDFIVNGNRDLQGTLALLGDIYTNRNADQSIDLENRLNNLRSYFMSLNQRGDVITRGLAGLDHFMLGNEKLKSDPVAARELKSLRDQLALNGLQLGGAIKSKDMTTGIIYDILANEQKLCVWSSEKDLGYIEAMGGPQAEKLKVVMATLDPSQLSLLGASSEALKGIELELIYSNTLGAFTLGRLLLHSSDNGLQLIAAAGDDKLNLVLSRPTLDDLVSAGALNSLINSQQLGYSLFSAEGLNFDAMIFMNSLNVIIFSKDLGVVI